MFKLAVQAFRSSMTPAICGPVKHRENPRRWRIVARRSRAREVASQILYQADLNPGGDTALIESFAEGRVQSTEVREFSKSLINGVRRRNLAELDS